MYKSTLDKIYNVLTKNQISLNSDKIEPGNSYTISPYKEVNVFGLNFSIESFVVGNNYITFHSIENIDISLKHETFYNLL